MSQENSTKKCEHPYAVDAFEYSRKSKIGLGQPIPGLKHLYDCDICVDELKRFYGEIDASLLINSSLRKVIKQLKNIGYELNDKEFELLYKGSKFLATTKDEAENIREHFVPGYKLLIKKLEAHSIQPLSF